MTDQWTRVFEGYVAQARIAEGLLREGGIPAKAVTTPPGFLDAASVGTAVSLESVLVPPDRAQDAMRMLRTVEGSPVDAEQAQRDRLGWLCTRISFATLWSAFAVPLVPGLLGIWWGARYLREARTLDPRPPHVALVTTLMVLCALTLPLGVLLIRMVILAV